MPFIVAGFLTGIISGLFGVGGGEIFIPLLIYLFGFSQHRAQGTSLAVLLPPIGLLAALRYHPTPGTWISRWRGCWPSGSSLARPLGR
jgi:uncharacterized membrane protein YfcA